MRCRSRLPSARSRNIRGAGLCCLQSRGSVRHDEIHAAGNKTVYDGGAVCRLAGGVLRVKVDLAAVCLNQLLQLILKALRSRIQCLVLNQLNDAYLVAASRTGIAAGGALLSSLPELLPPQAVIVSAMAPAISAASNLFFMGNPSLFNFTFHRTLHFCYFTILAVKRVQVKYTVLNFLRQELSHPSFFHNINFAIC